jgi:hypothetical protein
MLESKIDKSTPLSENELIMLREKFINEYSKKRGWNPKELSTNQMLEIATQREYKQPGLLLG